MAKHIFQAAAIGVMTTIVLFGIALLAANAGYESLAKGLFWQNSLLQSLAPLGNIGTPQRPVYEGTPLNFLAFLASFPLGFFVYGSVAYIALAKRRA